MQRKLDRAVFAVFSDPHGGHRLGLCNPDTVLYQEGEDGEELPYHPPLGPYQQYMWPLYEQHVHEAEEFAAGDDLLLGLDGDATHGSRFPQDTMDVNVAEQVEIACYNMYPWFQIPNLKAVRLLSGTDVHVFGRGAAEKLVARMLAARFPMVDTRAYYHALLDVRGVLFDIAHHGPGTGIRNWLKGNVAEIYLLSLMKDDLDDLKEPPRVVLRAHYHELVRATKHKYGMGKNFTSDIFVLPSWCGPGSHSRKATQSYSRITHGMVLFEIVDGELGKIVPLKKTEDIRTKESL